MRYKLFFLALSLSFARYLLCYEYAYAPLDLILSFEAPYPFSMRILLPFFGALVDKIVALPPKTIFLFTDIIAAIILFWAFERLFISHGVPKERSFRALFFLQLYLLSLYTLLSHVRVFYPWDIPSLAFIPLALLFAQERRMYAFGFICFLATLNRETGLFLPLFSFAVCDENRSKSARYTVVLFLLLLLVEGAVQLHYGEQNFTQEISNNYNYFLGRNVSFFAESPIIALLTIAPVPLFWLLFWHSLSARYAAIGVYALSLFALALIAGYAAEPRVFCEAVVASFLPATILYHKRSSRS